MTFGAILSATDPVAVSVLLNEVGAPPRLKIHISGESLLNDGSAIGALIRSVGCFEVCYWGSPLNSSTLFFYSFLHYFLSDFRGWTWSSRIWNKHRFTHGIGHFPTNVHRSGSGWKSLCLWLALHGIRSWSQIQLWRKYCTGYMFHYRRYDLLGNTS